MRAFSTITAQDIILNTTKTTDTDAEGIVYHARYLEIAERARMNWLRGITYENNDIGFVVRELNIKYLQPLKLADDFVVETKITDAGLVSVKVEQKFVKDGNVCAIINLKVAYLGADMRLKQIPDGFISALM